MTGLSVRNLNYMRSFAESWPSEIVQRAVAQLPWGHNIVLLQKLDDPDVRDWYAREASARSWSRKLLEHHIAMRLHERHGNALTNFAETLPAGESELREPQ